MIFLSTEQSVLFFYVSHNPIPNQHNIDIKSVGYQIMQLPFNHNSLYDVPDVTPDIKKSSSKITVHDNHIIYIENYKCIISCSDTRILVKTKKNTISINGICLKIEYYCPEELKISGNILYINYE